MGGSYRPRQDDDIGGCHQWENGGQAAEYPGLKCPSATNRTQAPGDLRTHGRVKRGVVHVQIWSVLHNACLPPRRNLNSASRQQRDEHWAVVDLVGKAPTSVPSPCPTGSRICVRPELSEWSLLFKLRTADRCPVCRCRCENGIPGNLVNAAIFLSVSPVAVKWGFIPLTRRADHPSPGTPATWMKSRLWST